MSSPMTARFTTLTNQQLKQSFLQKQQIDNNACDQSLTSYASIKGAIVEGSDDVSDLKKRERKTMAI